MTEQDQGRTGEPVRPRAVQMPTSEDMVKGLREAGLYGKAPQSDRLYDRFIAEVADTPKVGRGLLIAWQLSMYDTISDLPLEAQKALNMNFDIMIDAVTPDQAVGRDAKEAQKEMIEKLRQAQSNDPAA